MELKEFIEIMEKWGWKDRTEGYTLCSQFVKEERDYELFLCRPYGVTDTLMVNFRLGYATYPLEKVYKSANHLLVSGRRKKDPSMLLLCL